MPYPNVHSARVRNPEDFIPESFRNKKIAEGLSVIVGKLKGGDGAMVAQSYRFDKNVFTTEQAKKWLDEHDIKVISFEEATERNDFVRAIFATDSIVTREEGTNRSIGGYAARFNSRSVKFGDFFEMVSPGAFSKSISEGNVVAIWNHNPDIVLGRQRSGTLQLVEDGKGLMFDLSLPDTQWGRDAYTSIQRRDVDGMSFGFRIRKSSWSNENGAKVRSLVDVDLKEISPTAFPAYQATSVDVRSMVDDYYGDVFSKLQEERDDETDDMCYYRLYAYRQKLTLT